MIAGKFIRGIPFIRVAIASESTVRRPAVIVDTGFTGDLQIPPDLADELGLETPTVTRAQIANGQIIEVPVALADAALEGQVHNVEVLISTGLPLAGIGIFSKFGYKVTVDCKNKTIVLEKA